MFRIIIAIISVFCALFLSYGIIFGVIENEPNHCRMTYMFEYPQFVRIPFSSNKYYPKYGLYAYSEGAITERARSMYFTGAPVIFIPGNAGSYKQARSLASVAIRKGIDNGWYQHLDYFSIDFNEEYNGLFGGYLENQKNFAKLSIEIVLNLYSQLSNKPEQVVLVGHSMGGKIAQSLLVDEDISPLINTIITIATPIDEPVLKIDEHFSNFYAKINNYLEKNRSFQYLGNETNHCLGILPLNNIKNESLLLDDKLIISIGGGTRDFTVHSGLTFSKYSDINTLTTSIPNVWASTDHLCSVWCLQLVLVLNRFLHSILSPYSANRKHEKFAQRFVKEKSFRLTKAEHFLVKPNYAHRFKEIELPPAKKNIYEWEEDSRRVFNKYYENGLNKTIIQMIRLTDSPHHKYLSVVAVNVEYDDNLLMGCAAIDFSDGMRYCKIATPLSKYITKIPTIGDNKILIKLNLHKIRDTFSRWTHIVLRFNPTRKRFSYAIDIFDPAYRFIKISAPKWNSFTKNMLLEDTVYGSSYYKFEVSGIEDSYQSLALDIKPRICSKKTHHSAIQLCIPWLKNCEKYQHFTHEENRKFYIDFPKNVPNGYNSTKNPVIVQFHLDPNCRFTISYKNSFGGTMYRIIHHHFMWIPSHMVGILLMAFRHQLTITPAKLPFKCGKLQTGLLVCSSFFIITMSRILGKFCQLLPVLPELDSYSDSMLISILIHGTAFALLMITTISLWISINIYGNMAHKILLKIVKLPISLPSITDSVMPIIEKIPISSGIILVVLASSSCGGVALILGWLIYFMQILKHYEDYLEEFVFDTAKIIAEKLFGKFKSKFFNQGDKNENEQEFEDKANKLDNPKNDKCESIGNINKKSEENLEKNILITDTSKENIGEICKDNNTDEEIKLRQRKTLHTKPMNKKEQNSDTPNVEKKSSNNETKQRLNSKLKNDNKIKQELEVLVNTYDATSEQEFPEDISELELNKLLDEAISKQKKILDEKKKKETLERLEYDSVHDSLSGIYFHLTLLILLGILTLLNIPATISWAKNYSYNAILSPDPSFTPALIVLISISVLWQCGAPRNVHGYTVLSGIFYCFAAGCVLYCQDSIYRLNFVISAVFAIITLQQLFIPKKSEEIPDEENLDLTKRMKMLFEETGDLNSAD